MSPPELVEPLGPRESRCHSLEPGLLYRRTAVPSYRPPQVMAPGPQLLGERYQRMDVAQEARG